MLHVKNGSMPIRCRNLDLYEGGTILGEKDVEEYVAFVSKVLDRVHSVVISSNRSI